MTTQTNEVRNLPALICVLSDLTERAQREYHAALVPAAQEALAIAQGAYTVFGGINLHLYAALASIRLGQPEEAADFIKLAQNNMWRWAGATISEAGDTPVTGTPGEPVT